MAEILMLARQNCTDPDRKINQRCNFENNLTLEIALEMHGNPNQQYSAQKSLDSG